MVGMPLNEPALELASDPRSVPVARRWAVDALTRLGRPELADCAELGTSELVTNAIIHATGPITVRVRGTVAHPRVEVSDGSTRPPDQPTPVPDDVDDLLTTYGRGLSIVARCSVAWGTTIEESGKIVWFEPAVEAGEVEVAGVVTGTALADAQPRRPKDEVERPLTIRDADVATLAALVGKFRELRRELRLLALAHAAEYPLVEEVNRVFDEFDRALPTQALAQVISAIQRGDATVDIRTNIPESAAPVVTRMMDMLELTDEFCRAQRLLALARTEHEVAFQRWWLGELVAAAEGRPASSWADVAGTQP